jgi:hypothetical protein
MSYYNLCGIGSQHSNISKGKGGGEIKILVDLFNQIRKKLVIFVHFKGFNISQNPKSSPLSYFAQQTSLNWCQIDVR